MSTLHVTNIGDGTDTVGTSYVINGSAKAWFNFDGSLGTPAVSGSFNVSSLTDNATGNYDVNLTTNMNDAVYSVAVSMDIVTIFALVSGLTASAANIKTSYPYDGVLYDSGTAVTGTVDGDLA